MRISDLLLSENLMDMRQSELQRSALACGRGGSVRRGSRLLSNLGHHLIALGSWLYQTGAGATLEHDNTCLGGGIEARSAGR